MSSRPGDRISGEGMTSQRRGTFVAALGSKLRPDVALLPAADCFSRAILGGRRQTTANIPMRVPWLEMERHAELFTCRYHPAMVKRHIFPLIALPRPVTNRSLSSSPSPSDQSTNLSPAADSVSTISTTYCVSTRLADGIRRCKKIDKLNSGSASNQTTPPVRKNSKRVQSLIIPTEIDYLRQRMPLQSFIRPSELESPVARALARRQRDNFQFASLQRARTSIRSLDTYTFENYERVKYRNASCFSTRMGGTMSGASCPPNWMRYR